MKNSGIFWGLLLILAGFCFLLNNLGFFDLDWSMVSRLWPVLLIFWGLSYLPGKFKSLALGASIVTFVALFYFMIDFDSQKEIWSDNTEDTVLSYGAIKEPLSPGTRAGEMEVRIAAGEFVLTEGNSESLLELKRKGRGEWDIKRSFRDSTEKVSLYLEKGNSSSGNEAKIFLNPNIDWALDIKAGGADVSMDYKDIPISRLKLQSGGASHEIRIGDKQSNCEIEIHSGASDIELEVPKNSGCYVISKSGLSNIELDDFERNDDRSYQTENFNTASNKIIIEIHSGVSNIEIDRY